MTSFFATGISAQAEMCDFCTIGSARPPIVSIVQIISAAYYRAIYFLITRYSLKAIK